MKAPAGLHLCCGEEPSGRDAGGDLRRRDGKKQAIAGRVEERRERGAEAKRGAVAAGISGTDVREVQGRGAAAGALVPSVGSVAFDRRLPSANWRAWRPSWYPRCPDYGGIDAVVACASLNGYFRCLDLWAAIPVGLVFGLSPVLS